MTITLTKEMQQMKEMIRNFVEREVEPFAIQIEEEDAIPGIWWKKRKTLAYSG